jgi:site-specific recombinase XerD
MTLIPLEASGLPTVITSNDRHPVAVYLAHLAPGSRRTMLAGLHTIAALVSNGQHTAETLPWHELDYQHTAAVRSLLAERYAPATANKLLSALRGVLKEAWRLGLTDAETYQRAADLASVRGDRLLRGRGLSSGELAALLRVCMDDSTPAGVRDAALIGVLYGAGLRRSEAAALALDDYDAETASLTVLGKGNKERLSYAAPALAALTDWLLIRGDTPGPLFCPITRNGTLQLRSLTDQAIYNILQKRAAQAGIPPFSPHDLRRSFVSDLLDAGADISTVQHLAGHSRVETTARYDRRGERAKRKASGLLHLPYRPRGAMT